MCGERKGKRRNGPPSMYCSPPPHNKTKFPTACFRILHFARKLSLQPHKKKSSIICHFIPADQFHWLLCVSSFLSLSLFLDIELKSILMQKNDVLLSQACRQNMKSSNCEERNHAKACRKKWLRNEKLYYYYNDDFLREQWQL